MSNGRGQYGAGSPARGEHSFILWLLGGIGLTVVGAIVLGSRAVARPRLSAHEKEMRAWEAEFPGLPWYMDQVKDSRQLDMWERARDHWERTR